MNRILFEKKSPTYELDSRDGRFEHVRGVLRMRVGDEFDVGVVNGPVGRARITSLNEGRMVVEVVWGSTPPTPPPVQLLVGMCRPATARKILTTAPTLGVSSLHFAATHRSDPAFARSSLWKDGEWRARLKEGVEQAFDTRLPDLHVHGSLTEALALLPDDGHRLALDVYEGTQRLSDIPLSPGEQVCLAIGPERGWGGPDRDILRENGFQMVSLNDRVLRVETAVIVCLSLVHARLGNL